jgi:hypothetical protein
MMEFINEIVKVEGEIQNYQKELIDRINENEELKASF